MGESETTVWWGNMSQWHDRIAVRQDSGREAQQKRLSAGYQPEKPAPSAEFLAARTELEISVLVK